MSISNFDFPKVTLRQVFQAESSGAGNGLGVACIGKVYKYNSPELTKLENIVWSGDLSGFTAKIPDRTVATPSGFKVNISSGVWTYCMYEPDDDSDSSTGVVLNGNNLDFGTDMVEPTVKWGHALAAGDYVLIGYANGFVLRGVNQVTYKDKNDKSRGFDRVVLGTRDYLHDGGSFAPAGAPASFTLCLSAPWTGAVDSGISVDASDSATFSVVADNIADAALADVLPALADESSSTAAAEFGFVALDKVNFATIDVRYRSASALSGAQSFGAVSSLGDINYVLGPASADNPVALGCYFALAAGSGTVYYKGVADSSGADNPTAYADALDYLDRYNDIYSIVPCTEDSAVVQACMAKVDSVSLDIESKRRMSLWYGISCASQTSEANDEIDGLLAGNVTHSYRAQCVWADGAVFGGEALDHSNYALAAAAAGMRASQPVHRPLSNLGYSFFSVSEPHAFSKSLLKRLGSNGIWIIANNVDGQPINMRQVTSAAADSLNMDEESMVANADDIAMTVAGTGNTLVGCSNISPNLLGLLGDMIARKLDHKRLTLNGAYIGPQLLEWEMTRAPYQDPVNLDHILAEFTITPPRPFNQFHMTLVVL